MCAFDYGPQRKRQPEGHNKRSTVSPVDVYGLYEFMVALPEWEPVSD